MIDSAPFRSRVARRVFALFVLAALLPLATLGFVAGFQVTGVLQSQTQDALRLESRRYGSVLMTRLLDAQPFLVDSTPEDSASDPFETVWEGQTDGWQHIRGERRSPPSAWFAQLDGREFRESGKMGLAVHSHGEGAQAVMIAPVSNGIRIGFLKPDYLMGSRAEFAANTEYCVQTLSITLFCSDTRPEALAAWRSESKNSADLRFETDNTQWIGSRWRLFLGSGFESESWDIVAFLPERIALATLATFQRAILLSLAIGLIVVVLIASTQIRRSLGPLEILIRGTKAFADRRFNERIDIGSAGDEFAALADSLNSMAERLEHQFETLDLMAKVDNEILCSSGIDPVLEQSLGRLRELVGAAEVTMIMSDPDHPTTARSFSADASGTTLARRELSAGDRTWIEALGPGTKLSAEDAARFFTADTNAIYAWRIDTGTEAQSALFVYGSALTEEEKRSISDFAARMAVALTAAERDAELYRRAHLDHLTGLPNRELFNDRLTQAIALAKSTQTKVGVLFIDLDRFKDINDSLGHNLGDEVLKVAASRLAECTGPADTVARLGGDEFIIVAPQYGDETRLRARVERVLAALAQPIQASEQELFLTASVGVASYPRDGESLGELLRKADAAMYAAKEKGGADARRFSEQMDQKARRRVSLAAELRRTIEQDELWLAFQPKISLETGAPMGAEALARWSHPERGVINPGEFMPVVEETGLMEPFGEWLLHKACAHAASWHASRRFHGRLAVNISARQIRREDFLDVLDRSLATHKLQSVSLELELTESALAEDIGRANTILEALRSRGYTVAIDDFGTGYSSLEYIRSLTFDVLKIDQTFVRDLTTDRRAEAIARAVVSLGTTLNKVVVAEGIETAEQAEILSAMGCQLGQGFYFARPMAEEDLLAWADDLREQKAIA